MSRTYFFKLLLLPCLLALGACATGPDPRDPLEPWNRRVYRLNDAVDSAVLKPAALVYRDAVPPLARTGVSNFFGNLGDLWSAANSALQLEVRHAGEDFMRFGVNTVFGFGGVLDIATELGIERHREDFGLTLARWGVPAGPYLVLPLLGPSTLRDTAALPVDYQGDPLSAVNPVHSRLELRALHLVDLRANLLRATSVLDDVALDKYRFTRDAYLQRRGVKLGFQGGLQSQGYVPPPPGPGGAPSAGEGYVPPADEGAGDGYIPPPDEPAPTGQNPRQP